MFKKEELKKLKTTIGFDIWQTEKDYLQHLFLLFLSRHMKNELAFKGGTALQKAYGLNRFSIDLDFTLNGKLDVKEITDKIITDLNNFGCKTESGYIDKKTGTVVILKIQGPLYDGREKTLSSLRIEISLREKILLQPVWKEIVPIYADLQPYIIYIMHLEEILAEKVRAVLTRTKARDVYDLWFLLKRDVAFDMGLIRKKLGYYNQEWNFKEFEKKLRMSKTFWVTELGPLVVSLPDFEEVKKTILKNASE